ncbi:MAG: DNA topoisomerase III, partial [Flavobacteriaceae bacterium]|nr:DNA topoisomerase III [Flavobacteriaceae bacterium]
IPFKATGKQILEPGWREIYIRDKKSGKEKTEEEEKIMPVFESGEKGVHEPFIHRGKTTPPKFYTEASLLRAMETAGKQVEDEEMRELLKDNGIGRPSTRANIIETLFHRKYIEKKKKNIYATQTGMDLIDTIQNELLKSPELTGTWERKLRLMEKGEYESELFKQELIEMVTGLTHEVKNSQYRRIAIQQENTVAQEQIPPKIKNTAALMEELLCPKCKTHKLIKGKTAYGCSNFKECGFKVPFEVYGKKLTDKQLSDLINKGRTSKIKGVTLPEHPEKKDVFLSFNEDFGIIFEL